MTGSDTKTGSDIFIGKQENKMPAPTVEEAEILMTERWGYYQSKWNTEYKYYDRERLEEEWYGYINHLMELSGSSKDYYKQQIKDFLDNYFG